jgi:ABC-type antimicrobial peptide transport system ATPase subunit
VQHLFSSNYSLVHSLENYFSENNNRLSQKQLEICSEKLGICSEKMRSITNKQRNAINSIRNYFEYDQNDLGLDLLTIEEASSEISKHVQLINLFLSRSNRKEIREIKEAFDLGIFKNIDFKIFVINNI